MSTKGWHDVYTSYKRAINDIHHPLGSGEFRLRGKSSIPGNKQDYSRNGVTYLRDHFVRNMVEVEDWQKETAVGLKPDRAVPSLLLYPEKTPYQEPLGASFGGFDFLTTAEDQLRVAIEWETGNISSSHRSMNKLTLALKNGVISAGVLIVPSRKLYLHLTDRVGNISELSGYIELWQSLGNTVKKGLLAITVVEYDKLVTDDDSFPYLKSTNAGRAKQGKARREDNKKSILPNNLLSDR